MDIILLEIPLSPTIPRQSPASMSKDTPFTASIIPSCVVNETFKSRTENKAISAILRVKCVAQTIANEEHGDDDRDVEKQREKQLPQRAIGHRPGPFRDQRAK